MDIQEYYHKAKAFQRKLERLGFKSDAKSVEIALDKEFEGEEPPSVWIPLVQESLRFIYENNRAESYTLELFDLIDSGEKMQAGIKRKTQWLKVFVVIMVGLIVFGFIERTIILQTHQ
ncbi:hypothetical protein [Motiliproteus sp. MSK22-1]|uniref:hypothetical protein n=1 Tax=Motiliproteus sp. MSK22-1 TaxID=1897630 RepID=UPI0009762D22|nr:hypothetical protein [Motiliproteus sp. MSK22-1]OMH39753.1 hypothetical protein BGP75_01475 [Motiliproteus sp. MSK22-1]